MPNRMYSQSDLKGKNQEFSEELREERSNLLEQSLEIYGFEMRGKKVYEKILAFAEKEFSHNKTSQKHCIEQLCKSWRKFEEQYPGFTKGIWGIDVITDDFIVYPNAKDPKLYVLF